MSRIGAANMAIACVVLAGWLATSATAATVLELSTHSSDQTDPAHLRASVQFSVFDDVLAIAVTNQTSAPNAYRINELYFNAAQSVEGLTVIDGPVGWELHQAVHGAGKFGRFSYGLIGGVGNSPAMIDPEQTLTWTFQITGSADVMSFTSQLSTLRPGDTPSILVAKFVSGPGGGSSFGALVPAPAAWLMILGVLASGPRRRRFGI